MNFPLYYNIIVIGILICGAVMSLMSLIFSYKCRNIPYSPNGPSYSCGFAILSLTIFIITIVCVSMMYNINFEYRYSIK